MATLRKLKWIHRQAELQRRHLNWYLRFKGNEAPPVATEQQEFSAKVIIVCIAGIIVCLAAAIFRNLM